MKKGYFIIVLSLILAACNSEHSSEIEAFRQERLLELKAPFGWASVTGLYQISNSAAYFGSKDNNDYIITNAATGMGWLEKTDNNEIIMHAYPSLRIEMEGKTVKAPVKMKTDMDEGGPSIASWRSLQWHIIEREGDLFLRVKDSLSTYRAGLDAIPSYPTDSKFKVIGQVINDNSLPSEISYTNILGMQIKKKVAAYIQFNWEEKEYQLAAIDNDDKTYMIMIYDGTNQDETYGGGRYLYPEKANETGQVILDFNKLLNPPCVFTPFATCPLPPEMNKLPFRITSGEKYLKLY